MPYLLVRHTVADYDKWEPFFDEHGTMRKASGSKGARVFRNRDNPNDLVILLEWDDLAKAQEFAQSDDLRQVMQRAGVVSQPEAVFLDEVHSISA
jgi:heme-degrading monooxygenase HmoA